MKKILSIFLVTACLISFSSQAQEKISPEAEKLFNSSMSQINARHKTWVINTGKMLSDKKLIETEAKPYAEKYAAGVGNLNDGDIMALCFLVMMQAAKSAQEDLKSIMEGVKKINESKESLRKAQSALNETKGNARRSQLDSVKKLYVLLPQAASHFNMKLVKPKRAMSVDSAARIVYRTENVSLAELENAKEKIKNDLETLNDINQSETIRLQVYMERRNKMIVAISNVMKKFSDTQNSIISNLK